MEGTPLELAVRGGTMSVVDVLLRAGATTKTAKVGAKSLYAAAERKFCPSVPGLPRSSGGRRLPFLQEENACRPTPRESSTTVFASRSSVDARRYEHIFDRTIVKDGDIEGTESKDDNQAYMDNCLASCLNAQTAGRLRTLAKGTFAARSF